MAPKENLIIMQKNIRLWEVLMALVALVSGFGIFSWNLYTIAIESKKDIMYNSMRVDKIEIRQENLEKKWDERQSIIQKDIESIRIMIENKANRK